MQANRRDALKMLAAAATGAAVGGVAVGLDERRRVELTRATLQVTSLPPEFSGFKIALLTDLHRSGFVPADLLEDAVTLTMQQRPDLIVLGGDYITSMNRAFVEPAADAVAALSAPAGVLAVMGNHDDERAVAAAFTRRAIRVLREERARLTLRGASIDFVGIGYWTKRQAAIALLLDPAATSILVAHDPRRLTEAAALNIPLVLSGHTHGGQVVLPWLGPINQFRFPVVSGAQRLNETLIFVSRGIGTIYLPVRLNCPPEVAVLTLERREPGRMPGEPAP